MIKLSSLIKEFIFGQGHLGNYNAVELTSESIENLIPYDEIGSGSDLAKKYLSFFKRNGVHVGNVGEYDVFKDKSGDATYYLVDLNAPIEECILGYIGTYLASFKGAYSPKNAFEIKGACRQVHISKLANELRGQGIGSALYDIVWNDSDAFSSDKVLYEGSYNMWVKHIFRNAAFFGIVIGGELSSAEPRIIIPARESDALNKDLLAKTHSSGFVAIKNAGNIPAPLRKVAYNLKGVDIANELVVITSTRNSFKQRLKNGTLYNFIEGFTSMRQLLAGLERLNDDDTLWTHFAFGQPTKKITTLILALEDATLIVKTQGDELVSVFI